MSVRAIQPVKAFEAMGSTSPATAILNSPARGPRLAPDADRKALRGAVGAFVGSVFYGTLLRQMQQSKFKTSYLSGGRAEEVFQGQLGLELAKRLGRSAADPVVGRIFETIQRRLNRGEKNDA